VAHVARVKSVDEVQAVRRKLLQNKKIAKATHNILAYRIQLDSGVVAQDHDEDGETAAGGKYERQREKYNHSYVRATLNTDFQI
jgi:putative IMPACT (imprinted ancient) family translation regulator